MFDKIRHYYQKGYYKQKHMDKLLEAGALTQDEYDEILGMKRLETEI